MDARVKRTPGRLDRSRQAAPQIFETLRDRIMSLELKPNTLLSRSALQSEFGISQTPVRDALMKLEQEGLVEIYPQHATVGVAHRRRCRAPGALPARIGRARSRAPRRGKIRSPHSLRGYARRSANSGA